MTNEKRRLEYGKWKMPQKLRLAVCLIKKNSPPTRNVFRIGGESYWTAPTTALSMLVYSFILLGLGMGGGGGSGSGGVTTGAGAGGGAGVSSMTGAGAGSSTTGGAAQVGWQLVQVMVKVLTMRLYTTGAGHATGHGAGHATGHGAGHAIGHGAGHATGHGAGHEITLTGTGHEITGAGHGVGHATTGRGQHPSSSANTRVWNPTSVIARSIAIPIKTGYLVLLVINILH